MVFLGMGDKIVSARRWTHRNSAAHHHITSMPAVSCRLTYPGKKTSTVYDLSAPQTLCCCSLNQRKNSQVSDINVC